VRGKETTAGGANGSLWKAKAATLKVKVKAHVVRSFWERKKFQKTTGREKETSLGG